MTQAHPSQSFLTSSIRASSAWVMTACATLAMGGMLAASASAQTPAAAPALRLAASTPATASSAPKTAIKGGTVKAAGPAWSELTPAQQQALKPLQTDWHTLTDAHKRKWLALSQNYPKLPPPEQAKLHSRMTEWATLSPRQRSEARLNFAEAGKHSPDEKKAKWQAYQALSPEEKQKLAAGAKPKPQGAAPAIKPVSPQKLAVVPVAKPDQKQHPALAGAPNRLDHNTLLPHPVPASLGTPATGN